MCVASLLCGSWADLRPFHGFTLNGFLSLYKVYQVCGLQRIGPTDPTETIVFLRYKSLYFERYVTVPMVIQSNL